MKILFTRESGNKFHLYRRLLVRDIKKKGWKNTAKEISLWIDFLTEDEINDLIEEFLNY